MVKVPFFLPFSFALSLSLSLTHPFSVAEREGWREGTPPFRHLDDCGGRIELQRKLIRRRADSCTEEERGGWRVVVVGNSSPLSLSTIASRDFFPRPPVYWISGVIAAGKSVFHRPSPGIYCSISDNSRGNKEPRVSRLIPWFRTGVQTAVFDGSRPSNVWFIPLDRGKKYIYI